MTEAEVARQAALEAIVVCLLARFATDTDDPVGFIAEIIAAAHGAIDAGTVLADSDDAAVRVRRLIHREIARIGNGLTPHARPPE
jgi:hypothetical protein